MVISMKEVISVDGVWKVFGRTVALRNVSLKVPSGSVFLIMGPNGSGKSTLLKLITGLMKPTRGRIKVFGEDPWKSRQEIFARMGAMFEDHSPPDWATGRAYLEYKASLKGVKDPEKEALRVAKLFKITEFWDRSISTYSSGMRRKLALADAFIGDPELIILDEPTVALDKEARAILRETIMNGTKQGKTFVIASHTIVEFEGLVTHLAILSLGQVVVSGKVEDVMKKVGIRQVTIKTNEPETVASFLIRNGYSIRVHGNHIAIEGLEDPDEVMAKLKNLGVKVEISETRPSLWEIYAKALA
ncbi:MAG: ABC transporter ATP-binding protein [Thermoprotei archaeon]|nr:MAG: ABC transporter ATP-binding protein [Thermoprotei archaeon]